MFVLVVFFLAAGQLRAEQGPDYPSAAACEQAKAEAAAFVRQQRPEVTVVVPSCLRLLQSGPVELALKPEILSRSKFGLTSSLGSRSSSDGHGCWARAVS